jgi:hypothetical protein
VVVVSTGEVEHPRMEFRSHMDPFRQPFDYLGDRSYGSVVVESKVGREGRDLRRHFCWDQDQRVLGWKPDSRPRLAVGAEMLVRVQGDEAAFVLVLVPVVMVVVVAVVSTISAVEVRLFL